MPFYPYCCCHLISLMCSCRIVVLFLQTPNSVHSYKKKMQLTHKAMVFMEVERVWVWHFSPSLYSKITKQAKLLLFYFFPRDLIYNLESRFSSLFLYNYLTIIQLLSFIASKLCSEWYTVMPVMQFLKYAICMCIYCAQCMNNACPVQYQIDQTGSPHVHVWIGGYYNSK